MDYITVSLLADGLGLKGIQREEFFACAGLLTDEPQLRNTDKELETITDFFAHIPYPSFVQDSLFDLHFENTYMTSIFGMDPYALESYMFASIGPNILRVLFDPVFDAKNQWVGGETWHSYVCSLVYMFRSRSQKQLVTDRYRTILDCLMGWNSFCQIWKEVGEPNYVAYFPIPLEFHPTAKTRFRFILMDTTVSHFPTMQLQMTSYIPADKPTQMALDNLNANYN